MINLFLKITGFFLAAVIFSACDTPAGNDIPANNSSRMQESAQKTENSIPVINDDQLNAVYEHYALLTAALVDNDLSGAKISANAIEAGSRGRDWGSRIASASEKILSAHDIESQRKAYETLSNEFISLVRKKGMTSGTLYVEYCPMVFGDTGASWLSSSKEIRNPYFGDKMLTCGEVKETID